MLEVRNVIEKIVSINTSNGGHEYEAFVGSVINNELKTNPFFKSLSQSEWNAYLIERKLCRIGDFDFRGGNIDANTLYFIEQPNGSQAWPDALFVYKQRGLPFEMKSGKNGKITWNSGFPKLDCVYLYNDTVNMTSTLFLGRHIITQEIIDAHNEFSKELSVASKAIRESYDFGSNFSYYLRDMWCDNFNYTKNPQKESWKNEALEYIENYW